MTTDTATASDSTAKKDIRKLQRAIVDGLENVKGQEIVVFNTEHLSALFERVIIATGSSNRQTRALASGVVDAVRKAGFAKPRLEGESNGEWIIVDCGHAVVHLMQPLIRRYYHLEELWGDKPVRLKLGAALPLASEAATLAAASKAATAAAASPSLKRSNAARRATAKTSAASNSTAPRSAAAPARKSPARSRPAAPPAA